MRTELRELELIGSCGNPQDTRIGDASSGIPTHYPIGITLWSAAGAVRAQENSTMALDMILGLW